MAEDLRWDIDTPRLRLRRLRPDDAAATAAMITPEVSRWTGSWPDSIGVEETAERIRGTLGVMDSGGGPILAIDRKTDGALLGWVGLVFDKSAPRKGVLGYWLGEAHHGQGYGGEAAAGMVDEGWRLLDIDLIEAAANPDNAASIAVLRRLGMAYVGDVITFAIARQREETCAAFELARPAA